MANFGDFLLSLKPVKGVVNWSQRTSFKGSKGFSIYEVLKVFFKIIDKGAITIRASSVSFFFLLAIPPSCIFLFTLLPYIPMDNVETTIYVFLQDISPNENTYNVIHDFVKDFLHTERAGLLSFSFLLAIFYSSTAVTGILRTFNRDDPGFKQRNMLSLRWMAIKLNSLLVLLLLTAMVLVIAQSSVFKGLLVNLHFNNDIIRFLVNLARWIIILLLFFTIISLIYTYGAATEQRWKFITAGSTLATALIILSTLGFSYFVQNFSNYNKIYGSIGTVIILMVWVHINSFVLLIGFELNASIEILARRAERASVKKKKEKERALSS